MTSRILSFNQFLNIQTRLNDMTLPNWRNDLTTDHFRAAMFDEFAELQNSIAWKWWKKQPVAVDDWNIKIEAIDILHFSLSVIYLLEATTCRYDYGNNPVLWGYHHLNEYVDPLVTSQGLLDFHMFGRLTQKIIYGVRPYESYREFFSSIRMTTEEISSIYIAKATLNHIRQTSGYKDGSYKKFTNGVEDNAILKGFVDDFFTDTTMTLEKLSDNIAERFGATSFNLLKGQ